MASTIIAIRSLSNIYLVSLGNGQAIVADLEQGIRFPPWNEASILARGYWEACENDPQLLADLLQLKEAK
jgi:hypothetical protein